MCLKAVKKDVNGNQIQVEFQGVIPIGVGFHSASIFQLLLAIIEEANQLVPSLIASGLHKHDEGGGIVGAFDDLFKMSRIS